MRSFRYERAADPGSAARAGAVPGTAFLAGGTTMLDLMKIDVLRPDRLIDIGPLGAAFGEAVRAEADGGLRLSALASMADVADHPAVRDGFPVVAQSLALAASAQLRNMATLGGNVLQRTRCHYFRDVSEPCNKREPGTGCGAIGGNNRLLAVLGTSEHCIASYPGDFAQALMALDAAVEAAGPDGARRFPFAELHREPGNAPERENALRPGEIIAAFHLPALPWARRSLYLKVRDRESYAFALASAAVALDLGADGAVRDARIALGGVATRPWRARAAEDALRGRLPDEDAARDAAAIALHGAVTHGDNGFKPELARRTVMRAILACAGLEG